MDPCSKIALNPVRAGSQRTTSAVSEPATLTTMLRNRASDDRRWLIVTPPKPWSTITDGCPKTFSANPCPSSCTRIDTKLQAIHTSTMSMPSLR